MEGTFSLLSLAEHFLHAASEIESQLQAHGGGHIHEALTEAAELIEQEAKASLGEYQAQAGPFEAWQPLAPSTQEARTRAGYPLTSRCLSLARYETPLGHQVEGHEAEIGTPMREGVYLELGTRMMPPRSFLGRAGVPQSAKGGRNLVEGPCSGSNGMSDRLLSGWQS